MKPFAILLIGLSFLIVAVSACNIQSKPDIIGLLDVKSDTESFGGDVHLSVIQKNKFDASIIYNVKAKYKGRVVGFQIVIPESTNQSSKGFGKGIEIRSLGKISDDFRNAMAEIYKIKVDPSKKFVNKTSVAFVDLDVFAKSVIKDAKLDGTDFKKLKLFFDSPDGDEAEIFFNINKDQTTVGLVEKDEEYRNLLIKLFTQS